MNTRERRAGGLPVTVRQIAGLADLSASRYRPAGALRRLQLARFRRLAAEAVRDVPFHRERWREAGLRPEDIRSFDDLANIPPMSRSDLRGRPENEYTSARIDPSLCRTFMTSGTSGVPLSIHYRPEDERLFNLTWIRAYRACGLRARDHLAAFQADERRDPVTNGRWYTRIGLWRRTVFSAWASPESWLDGMARLRPNALATDAGTYRILAETVEASSRPAPRFRRLFNVSILIDPATRARIETLFGGTVFDLYGSFETGCLAWECPGCGGYHINSDTAVVEILKPDGREAGPGEAGEVVVTNLFSTAMPIIRYALGDIVVKADREPACGWPFPLLRSLEGRKDDFLRLADGRSIPPQPFHHIFAPRIGVRRWRVEQVSSGRVRVALETEREFNEASRALLQASVRDLLGAGVEIVWDFAARLPDDPGSKRRAVVNVMADGRAEE
ncbi:MAG: phenylacetate--CoA ligase family protein [Candidatus Aminicenantes bacterium]|nr:phenylacetate--CoA ligase family protein [Candidatus Aminicenantes bacterium]